MSADDLERLRHMLAAAREAISFIEGKSAEDLIHNRLLLLAVIKEVEIIGEAASRIPPEGNLVDAGNQSSCVGRAANE